MATRSTARRTTDTAAPRTVGFLCSDSLGRRPPGSAWVDRPKVDSSGDGVVGETFPWRARCHRTGRRAAKPRAARHGSTVYRTTERPANSTRKRATRRAPRHAPLRLPAIPPWSHFRPRPGPQSASTDYFSNKLSTGTTLILAAVSGSGNFSMILSSSRMSGGRAGGVVGDGRRRAADQRVGAASGLVGDDGDRRGLHRQVLADRRDRRPPSSSWAAAPAAP